VLERTSDDVSIEAGVAKWVHDPDLDYLSMPERLLMFVEAHVLPSRVIPLRSIEVQVSFPSLHMSRNLVRMKKTSRSTLAVEILKRVTS
jgi:hypothetical protein